MPNQTTKLSEIKSITQNLAWPVIIFLFFSLMGSSLINKTTILLAICYLFISNYRDTVIIGSNFIKAYGLLLLMLWDLVSISWSVTPTVSVLNVINDYEVLVFALFAAYHARNKDLAGSIKLTFIIVISLLAIYCIVFPGDSNSPHGLKSFYEQKNNLGFTAGLCTLILIMTLRKNLLDYLFLFISTTLLVLSQSKTSMVLVALICSIVFFIYWIYRSYNQLSVFAKGFIKLLLKATSAFLYLSIGAMVFLRERIADYLISNLSYDAFTGRGLLWVTVLTRSRDDLLFGLGRGGFWGADGDSEINQTSIVYQYVGWVDELISADGGYIDVIGAIGFLGLGLLLMAFIQVYRQNFKLIKNVEWKLYFSLITFLVLHNITETGFFKFTYSLWFIFMLLTFYLHFKQGLLENETPKDENDKKSIMAELNG